MEIKLQHIEGCPNWQAADILLGEVLEAVGRQDLTVIRQVIRSPEEAEAVGFRGSPTVLFDGVDPFSDPEAPVGLSCRIYRTAGWSAGHPSRDQLTAALA